MGITNFPNGINAGDASGNAGAFQIGGTAYSFPVQHVTTAGYKLAFGTVVVPSGAAGTVFATGLSTASYLVTSPYGTIAGTTFVTTSGSVVSGGTVAIFGVAAAGTVSAANGTATWLAIGT